MPPGVEEADMQGKVNSNLRVMGAEHVKGVPKIEGIHVAVPSPIRVRVRKMPFTGAMGNVVFFTFTNLASIGRGMGMDTGAIAGECDAILRDESILPGFLEGLEFLFFGKRSFLPVFWEAFGCAQSRSIRSK